MHWTEMLDLAIIKTSLVSNVHLISNLQKNIAPPPSVGESYVSSKHSRSNREKEKIMQLHF